jgi:hypothetical protein
MGQNFLHALSAPIPQKSVAQCHRVEILPGELYQNLKNNIGQTSKTSFKPLSKALPTLYRLS